MEATRKASLLMTHENIMLNITCRRAARNTASSRLTFELRSWKSQREAKQPHSGSLCRIIINYINCQSDQCRSRRLPESGSGQRLGRMWSLRHALFRATLNDHCLHVPCSCMANRINILTNNKHSLTYVGFLMLIPGSSVKRSGDITVGLN
jgi:hypothetical protein